MAIRVPWDKYEAAVLLDYILKVENGVFSRSEAVSIVSDKLRQRAIINGMEIDEYYRNENGISMQMSALRNCFLGIERGLTISTLFREIVALYKTDRPAFYSILQEELSQMNNTAWQEFLLWLKDTHPAHEKEIIASLTTINMLGLKNSQLDMPIAEITDEAKIEALQVSVLKPNLFGLHSKKTAIKAKKAIGIYLGYLRSRNRKELPDGADDAIKEQVAETVGEMVDFSANSHYAHTKPIRCEYKNQVINCAGWNALFINLVKAFYQDYSKVFPVGKSLSSSSRVDIGDQAGMIYPKEIADGIYLECNVSATGVINKIRALMSICKIPTGDVVIYYCKSGQNGVAADNNDDSVGAKKPNWTPMYTKELTELLTVHYQYGFRISSPIEMMRLRNYADSENISLPENDEELDREIKAVGVLIDGKVFALSDALLEETGVFMDRIFSEGAQVVFTEVLMEKHHDWFDERLIISDSMLKEILRKSRPRYHCGQNIISAGEKMSEHDAVVLDILRVAGNSSVVMFAELDQQLPYIPSEKIAWSLSASPEFVWISEGKYFIMKHFLVNTEDKVAILHYVDSECERNGFASITDLPFGRIPSDNYELSVTALHAAVFARILKGQYYLHGKIIAKEADGVDIISLLKAFCIDRDECTVTEVIDRATELTGAINKQNSMEALYETMVRADADRFVSENKVFFDVEKIDSLLSEVIGDSFGPIKAITTFALFPACGISWNHYVLESFCYRFSNKYRLVVKNYNDKNAGILKYKDLPLGYTDMLCEAAAASHIELNQELIGQFFFECGLTAKRKYSNLPEIIERARNIREER